MTILKPEHLVLWPLGKAWYKLKIVIINLIWYKVTSILVKHKPVHKSLNNVMTLNVQLYKMVWAIPMGPCGMGEQHRPKSKLA